MSTCLPSRILEQAQGRPARHVVSVSGGKDSTATYLLALEQTGGDFDAVFADTGNEHEATYEYVARLHERTGGPKVQTVKADFLRELARKRAWLESGKATSRAMNPWTEERVQEVLAAGLEPSGVPFLDLCVSRGMFPCRSRAFCSRYLKRFALWYQFQSPLTDKELHIVSWQGIRAEESARRSCYPMWELSPDSELLTIYRPLMGWSVEDVAAMHRRHGIKLNPLYGMGFSRVGCMPCIQSNKQDIRLIARLFPEHIAKIRKWERIVRISSRSGQATFFHQDTAGSNVPVGIDEVVRWSMTRRGGKQFDMLACAAPPTSEVCIYAGGLCE
ncbi:phosphoadenosine phosphosulfate reductase family protein [Desulfovibrio sp. SGI.169]|uniref:phosphoadenosine phosphosulfate reductase domain-containing protein n=1 Tax=Desulfovibrio sp. SGI.169 TaxID=3420561 RepID=UPI003D08D2BD